MIRGIYTSAWSMKATSKKMDVISNNLANVNTNAFKKDTVVFESFPDVLAKRLHDNSRASGTTANIGRMKPGSDIGEVYTYYSEGALTETGNSFDLAFKNSPSAFFTVGVTGVDGQVRPYYTRDGAFVLNAEGQMVTKDGYQVLGVNGPVTLNGSDFIVNDDGSVIQGGQVVNRLAVREFPDLTALRKFGSNMVEAPEGDNGQEFTGIILQGYIEQSNVNIIKEMVDMISVMRAYEANQKILQAQDGTLEKAVIEVGAVR